MSKTEIRPAATVIIARDAAPQFEIFMLRRTNTAVFASGMYVFPGGRVDEDDHSVEHHHLYDEPSADQAAQREALGDNWLAYWVAGIRETFEESGLLLAHDANGEDLSYQGREQAFVDYQNAVNAGELTLTQLCQQEDLRLAIDMIHFYNRWITPPGRPRRFDTRFFITAAPAGQVGTHDGNETVDSVWISPNEALAQNKAGQFDMMAVTVKQLQALAEFDSVGSLMEMAVSNRDFPTYRPQVPAN